MGAITDGARMRSIADMSGTIEPPSQQHLQAQQLAALEAKTIAEMGAVAESLTSNNSVLGELVGNFSGPQPTQLAVDPYIVDQYSQQLLAGHAVAAIEVVILPDGREFITEGHHRYVASQQTGIDVGQRKFDNGGPTGFAWSQVKFERLNND